MGIDSARLPLPALSAHDAPALLTTSTGTTDLPGRVIDLSQHRARRRALAPVALDLTGLGLEIAHALGGVRRRRALDFSIDDGLTAEADPVLARQVLTHLLGYAVERTAEQPVARIELRRARLDDRAAPAGVATFVVRDNGAPLPGPRTAGDPLQGASFYFTLPRVVA